MADDQFIRTHFKKVRRSGKGWVALCPAHGDKHHSLSITPKDDRFLVHCFAGCEWREIVDAANLRPSDLGFAGDHKATRTPEEIQRYVAQLHQKWRASIVVTRTLAEKYLRHRGITIPLPPALRFFPRAPVRMDVGTGWSPALVAGIQRPDDRFTGFQVTYLRHDGLGKAEVNSPRRIFGPMGDGAVRLAPTAATICVCEGIETGLSIIETTGIATWAALGAHRIHKIQFPPIVREVIVAADLDPTGIIAARQAAHAYQSRGLRVRIALPQGAKDFNEVTL